MGATEEEAMIGNAVEESAGVGDEIVPVTPFESASEAPHLNRSARAGARGHREVEPDERLLAVDERGVCAQSLVDRDIPQLWYEVAGRGLLRLGPVCRKNDGGAQRDERERAKCPTAHSLAWSGHRPPLCRSLPSAWTITPGEE